MSDTVLSWPPHLHFPTLHVNSLPLRSFHPSSAVHSLTKSCWKIHVLGLLHSILLKNQGDHRGIPAVVSPSKETQTWFCVTKKYNTVNCSSLSSPFFLHWNSQCTILVCVVYVNLILEPFITVVVFESDIINQEKKGKRKYSCTLNKNRKRKEK